MKRHHRDNRITLITFLLLGILASTACGQAIVQVPISDQAKRLEFNGFSVLPPQGEGWYVIMEEVPNYKAFTLMAKQLGEGKDLGIRTFQPHTVRATIKALDTGSEKIESSQELLEMIQETERAGPSERFTVIEENYALHPGVGEYSVLYDKLSEDREVRRIQGLSTSSSNSYWAASTRQLRQW